ncbi:MAG TPA: S8 family serine peptidase, partial [Pyrinomonadaceae bacterium]
MRLHRFALSSRTDFLCLLLTYALASSLFAPFAVKRVEAAPAAQGLTVPLNRNAPAPAVARLAQQAASWREGELLIRFQEHAPVSKMNQLLRANGAQWNGRLRGRSGIERLRLRAGADPEVVAATLRTSPLVDFTEPNYLINADQTTGRNAPDDPRYAEQWALAQTGARPAWETTTGSKETVIAVIDSGIDFTHSELRDNEWGNTFERAGGLDNDGNGYDSDLHGWDFVNNSAQIADAQGHGTAVAGLIAASGNNSTGIAGVMWQAGLMSLRVLDQTGTGDIADAVEAIDYAVDNGAQVINCSWGTDSASIALHAAIDRAARRGVVLVASAGNQAREIGAAPRYPASFELPNLLSVASTDASDQLASFSNWGMRHVSIAAPGQEILTTKMGGDYQTTSGTSGSAALVTGIAGLIKSLRPWLNADRTRELILRGARQAAALSDKVAAKGIASAAGALAMLNTLPATEGLDQTSPNNGGEHGTNGNGRSRQRDDLPGPAKRDDNGISQGDGTEFNVRPLPQTQGAPGSGLPNLDELRRRKPAAPQAAPSIPSTRCSHQNPDCRSRQHRAATESPADLLAWSFNPAAMQPLPGTQTGAVSDTPFKLGWMPGQLLAVLPLEPQSARVNVALAANGGAATASSTTPDGETPGLTFPASGVINGDRKGLNWEHGGGWRDGTDTYPDWLEVDFNSTKSIDEIDVFTIQDNYAAPVEPTETQTFGSYGVTAFDVQYWNGAAWATVPGGSVSGNNNVWRKFSFAAVTTSKIRVVVNNALAGRSRLVELEAWGTAAASTNVALAANGGVVTASSTTPDGETPGYEFHTTATNDGDRAGFSYPHNGFWRDGTGDTYPDWLQIDFSGTKSISEIDVFTVQDDIETVPLSAPTETMTFTQAGITAFDVQYWNGSGWITVPGGSVTGNNKIWRKFTFAAVTTGKIRVLVNDAFYSRSRIVELEAWNISSAPASDPSGNNYSSARLDAANRTGAGGVDLLSGNAGWSLPLLGLEGRAGLDLGLALSYNSLVWTKDASSSSIKFDADKGTPSPGFRLGFPVIQPRSYNSEAGKYAYLLLTPSGGRVELQQVGASSTYESADSSYLQLINNGASLLLRPPDGSQLKYELKNDQYYCVEVKDRNGNCISVSYYADGRISTVTDTLGRVVTFNYDAYLNLGSITQDWGGGVTHQWATFGWANIAVNTGFSGLTVVGPQNGTSIPVLNQVAFADGTRYNFEYNSYAQVAVVHHYAADNHQLAYSAYTHTLPPGSDDCPRVTEQRDWAENWNAFFNNLEATTAYSRAADHSSGQATAPDGTVYKELFATTGWQKGLTTGTEFWSAGVKKKWTTTAYTQDDVNLGYRKNPRVTETNIYDSDSNRKRTTVEYGAYAQWGLPYLVKEYAADATTPLRQTYTDYNLGQAYLDRRIIGLISVVQVSDSAAQWQTKVAYSYDAGGDQMQATATAATQHDAAYGASLTAGRGNVTAVARYDVTDINNDSKRLVTQAGYDANGSVVFTRDPLGHQSSISYADSFSDNLSRSTYAYPTKITPPVAAGESAESFSASTQYNYYFGAVTRTQGPVPAGQTQGPVQTFEYDAAGRVSRINTLSNNAYRRWVYDTYGAVISFTSVQTGMPEPMTVSYLDGAGRVRATGADNPNSTGGYVGQYTYYDIMGRAWKTSSPGEMNANWQAAGDEATGWNWTEQVYDWKGRPTLTTNPDGTTREASYGGCGCAGGEVVTVRDEVGRRQRMTADVSGRPFKTEILNWDQSVYTTSTNNYNARDQLTSIVEQAGSGGGASQSTLMSYDGYGRLKTRRTPAQTAATAYAYNGDETLSQVTDARGVVTSFGYNNRHQTTSISYSAPSGITATASATFSYDAAGNRTAMTDNSGSVSYSYDQLSRLTSETRQFSGLSGSYTLSYSYNLSGQLSSLTDPAGAQLSYGYDSSGRLTDVTGTAFAGITQYASAIRYRAWGALKSLSYGDNSSLLLSYNSRLLPTQMTGTNTLSKQYQYYQDGRLRYSQDPMLSGRYDRAYSYDQAGRVIEATSGPKARGLADTDNRPYDLVYQYDEMNHLKASTGRVWSAPHEANTGSRVYLNERNTGWQYDEDGRLTDSGETQYTYDAAGRAVSVWSGSVETGQTQVFDAEGLRTKLISREAVEHDDGTVTIEAKTQYFVRSSVTAEVITELDGNGQKERTFVYAGTSVVAWQEQSGTTQS